MGDLVLNVDDSEANRYWRNRVLRLAGIGVVDAASGAEAIGRAAEVRPAVVILDVNLPDMKGQEACRRIKRGLTPAPLVLLVSAISIDARARIDGLEAGADGYLVMPADAGELLAQVRAMLRLHHAESQVRERNALLRATLDSSPDAILAVDRAGAIVDWNARFLSMWGLSSDRVGRQRVEDVATGMLPNVLDAGAFRNGLLAVLANPERELVEALVLQDGRHLEQHAAPQRIDGACVGTVLAWRDVTERRRAEAAQLALAERLQESQKLEAIGELAGGIAHDFNNILAAILGNTDLARKAGSPEDAAESLDAIELAGERGTRLVQQILTFARRQRRDVQVLPLGRLVEETVRLLRAAIPSGVTLSVLRDPAAPPVVGDITQLQQVVMNLCTNALHALHRGAGGVETGRIHLRVSGVEVRDGEQPGLAPGRYATLTVSDDGVGMPPEVRARIFEPFFTTRQLGEGTGLGLCIVHGIVAQHRGGIVVESRQGTGTTFVVYLPAASESGAAVSTTPAEDTRGDAGAPDPGSPYHVWYVDDEPALVSLVTRLLERDGYRVTGYGEPDAALASLARPRERVDLLITDFNMPGRSGLDVARQARALRPDLPVVICSGYITSALEDEATRLGVRRLFYKPEIAGKLRSVVRHALGAAAGNPAQAGSARQGWSASATSRQSGSKDSSL